MKPLIYFVDDEANVLSGLRRTLRGKRDDWECAFFESGKAALDAFAERAPDAVVSDMRMPVMDGATLLTQVAEAYPATVRFVLSGEAELDAVYRVIGPSHQFMLKPCDGEMLARRLDTILARCATVADPALRALALGQQCLPTPSEPYEALIAEFQRDQPSIEKVCDIVRNDVALSLKLLQLGNSGYFGFRNPVVSPVRVARQLGIDTLGALAGRPGFARSAMADGVSAAFGSLCEQAATQAAEARSAALSAGLAEDACEAAGAAELMQFAAPLALVAGPPGQSDVPRLGAQAGELCLLLATLWGLPDALVGEIGNRLAARQGERLSA